ncbi:MAG TPA: sialate O-acetylesterase [Bryobacteraceae bacterium]|nr:sialate O-acetylesterase [Bryobacteraceae bacterium]
MGQKTLTIVVPGQSIVGNHGNSRYTTLSPLVQKLSITDGRIYRANSPLLGTTGKGGNWLPRLGDRIIQQRWADRVILEPISFGGSAVNEWNYSFESRLVDIAKARLDDVGLVADAIWWQQGPINTYRHTSKEDYARDLAAVISHFRRVGFTCPIFICQESYIPKGITWPPVRAAQAAAVNHDAGIWAGADTDILDHTMRFDDQHLNAAGEEKMAEIALEALGRYGIPFAPPMPTVASDL